VPAGKTLPPGGEFTQPADAAYGDCGGSGGRDAGPLGARDPGAPTPRRHQRLQLMERPRTDKRPRRRGHRPGPSASHLPWGRVAPERPLADLHALHSAPDEQVRNRSRRPLKAKRGGLCRRFVAAGAPQAHHRRRGGRRRPRTCRVPMGRDARLSPHAADRGAVANRRDRTPNRQDPSKHRRHKARSPRPYCHAQDGATQQVWGHRLRTADVRSRPANISVAVRRSTPLRRVLANLGPATSRRPPRIRPTIRTPGARSPAAPHLTAPFHIRRSNAALTWSERSPTPRRWAAAALRRHVADSPDREITKPCTAVGGVKPANYRVQRLLHWGVRWQTHRIVRLRGRSSRLVE
jgi:hypothetical protein